MAIKCGLVLLAPGKCLCPLSVCVQLAATKSAMQINCIINLFLMSGSLILCILSSCAGFFFFLSNVKNQNQRCE